MIGKKLLAVTLALAVTLMIGFCFAVTTSVPAVALSGAHVSVSSDMTNMTDMISAILPIFMELIIVFLVFIFFMTIIERVTKHM